MELETAKKVFTETEWSGDIRVNANTAIGAGRVLLKRIEELEAAIEAIVMHQKTVGGSLDSMSVVVLIAERAIGKGHQ